MSSPFGPTHPKGECLTTVSSDRTDHMPIDTYKGRVHVEWDPQAAVTPIGQLPFFYRIFEDDGTI